jgi:predicted phage baseplate assembly protein
VHEMTVARGNVVLVDHGDWPTVGESWTVDGDSEGGCCHCEGAVQDVLPAPDRADRVLAGDGLTWAQPVRAQLPAQALLRQDPRAALPAIDLRGGRGDLAWQAAPDLLASGADDRRFVVEMDDDGLANLRFGDGVLGRQPAAGDRFSARLRRGNGPAGNVGADSIVAMALASSTLAADIHPRNPLPAQGGMAAEPVADVRRHAPGAFLDTPLRAIVADDYAALAARDAAVQGAACRLRWTGSNYDATVVLDPRDSESLDPALATRVRRALFRYRRIGHDVSVRPARYVPLLVELFVCVRPDVLVAHVRTELLARFGDGVLRDGSLALFHPDRLLLGEDVLASVLVAQAQGVAGVAHVTLVTLARQASGASGQVPAAGRLAIGPGEVAQLDNDPDHPDRGRFTLTMGGGR